MRTPMISTAMSSSLMSWFIAQESRLHHSLQRLALRQAQSRAVRRFITGNQQLAESLFDAHFIKCHVAPLIEQAMSTGSRVSAEAIARVWFEQCKAPGARAADFDLSSIIAAAVEYLGYLDEELGRRSGKSATTTPSDTESSAEISALFERAVREDSNLELDWLWLYSKVAGNTERLYCLQKALYINPQSEMALCELAKMPTIDAPVPIRARIQQA